MFTDRNFYSVIMSLKDRQSAKHRAQSVLIHR